MENYTYQQLCKMNGLTELEGNTYGYCRMELINMLMPVNYKTNA